LIALGVKPRERIAYLGKNSDIYFELLMGAMKANVVMAPVNWRLAGPEVAFIVGDCKAPVLFVGPEFIVQARNLKTQLPEVRHIITTEGGAPEWQDFTAWRDAASPEDPKVAIGPADRDRHPGRAGPDVEDFPPPARAVMGEEVVDESGDGRPVVHRVVVAGLLGPVHDLGFQYSGQHVGKSSSTGSEVTRDLLPLMTMGHGSWAMGRGIPDLLPLTYRIGPRDADMTHRPLTLIEQG